MWMTPIDAAQFMNELFAIWTETNHTARRAAIETHFDPDVDLHDPDGEFIGYDALEAFSNALQQRFPGARFEMVGHPDRVGNALRTNWRFGPDRGTDFVLLHDQKVRSLYAFVQPASPDRSTWPTFA
jgi:hypothetical protein